MMDTSKTQSGSRPRRLCIVTDNIDPHAGWGRLATRVGQGFADRGWDVGYIVNSEETQGAVILWVPMRRISYTHILTLFRSILRIRRFVAQYDIVLCYDVNPYGFLVTLATIGLRTRVCIHALGTYSLFTRSRLRNAIITWTYRRASMIFVVSDFVRRHIEQNGHVLPAYHIVPVGVDPVHFSHGQVSSNVHSRYLLTVGAVKRRKGYHYTIPAFAYIARKYPDVTYVIVGNSTGGYAERIRETIQHEGLLGKVIFRSGVDDEELAGLYRGATVYVQTSVTDEDSIEGFGMSYLEAGACGVPAIGARDSGAEAAIIDGMTGFLVEHKPESIAQAISYILEHPKQANAMGKSGIERAHTFAWDHVIDTHAMYFAELLR